MDTEKDYYAVLGVLPSIDDIALTAVYRALLKKYHPDVSNGSKEEAEKRTKETVEAYEVLGNAESRRAYDKVRKNIGLGNYQQEDTTSSSNETIADWEMVKRYFPETEQLRVRLSNLSQLLSFAFQITVLEKKMGSDASATALKLESEFLERYFGKNQTIHRFVIGALQEGRSDVAKEVNRAIRVLRTPADPLRFIKQVRETMNYIPASPRLDRPISLQDNNYERAAMFVFWGGVAVFIFLMTLPR